MATKDGRAIAWENEVSVLRALHRFGWLRTRDMAALVWLPWARKPIGEPTLKPPAPTASGLRMAQRTLKRMTEKRLVLSTRAPNGSLIYSLAEAGVRALLQLGIAAASGKDLMRTFSSAHFRHRCISTEIAISAIVEGFRVSTEREIAQDRWIGGIGIAGKKPDVFLRADDGRVWWVEVERSRKNSSDYSKLLKWLGAVSADMAATQSKLLGDLRWGKVVFICKPAFQAKLTRDLKAAGVKSVLQNARLSYKTALYSIEETICF